MLKLHAVLNKIVLHTPHKAMNTSAQGSLASSPNQKLAGILIAHPVGSSYDADPSRPLIFLDRSQLLHFCTWQLRSFSINWSAFRPDASDIYSACADLEWPVLLRVDIPNQTLVYMGGEKEILELFGT